jgi:hypothetical protein
LKKRAFLALIFFALAACGGGSSPSGSPALPPAPRLGQAQFSLVIPAQTSIAGRKRPKYISPATQSVSISVTGESPVIANVTPGSPGCTTSSSGTSCTITVPAPFGQDTFTVTLFSGQNGTGSILASGTVSANIVLGGTVPTISITLNSVVSSVVITLGNPSPLVGTATTIPVTVTAKDNTGATIIAPGSYTEAIQLTDSDTSGHTALSATTVNGPSDVITLSYDGSAAVTSATISAQVTGTITSVTPAILTPQLPATPTPSPTPTPTPAPTPTATPTPTPTPIPALNVAPAALNFTIANNTQGIGVSESGYTGTFSESDNCSNIATVSPSGPASANGPNATFNVTSVAAGTCTVTISDQNGQSVGVTINVTITQGIIQ